MQPLSNKETKNTCNSNLSREQREKITKFDQLEMECTAYILAADALKSPKKLSLAYNHLDELQNYSRWKPTGNQLLPMETQVSPVSHMLTHMVQHHFNHNPPMVGTTP